ncbi:GNAT family N-acetyltransferase [Amycolatopsis minnesotensis]|uniref:GNAT family N-acetyltransferase n=1 Tax=Amycolatopsis minnesotensis TaxID=337894 RepID=A0ABP5C2K9_9PSEU
MRSTWVISGRPAGAADSAALLRRYYDEVASRYWNRPLSAAEVDEVVAEFPDDDITEPAGLFFVGTLDGRPAGCAGLRFVDGETAELTRVFVDPSARGTGGAPLLVAAAEEAARLRGIKLIRLDTRDDLVEARALYAKLGYAEVEAFNSEPYAEHWFAKELVTG